MDEKISLPTLNPMTACSILGDKARLLPPYIHFVTKPTFFAGPVFVISVLGGTRRLDVVLKNVPPGRVIVIDAQCQTHTAFVGKSQVQAAITAKAKGLLVLGAVHNPTLLNNQTSLPIMAMGVSARMGDSDKGVTMRHYCYTDIGPIQDEGDDAIGPGDSVVCSESGQVIAKTSDIREKFGEKSV